MTYRIMIWGTGRLGAMCVREVLGYHAFQLVGVYSYSADKSGLDAGEYAGIAHSGIPISTDAVELLAQECECVLYMAADWGDYSSLPEVAQLLRSGKNVVTPLPYHHARSHLSGSMIEQIEAACHAGGSTFYATGVNPDVVSSRILPALSGMCLDVEQISLHEVWRCGCVSATELRNYGFGLPMDVAAQLKSAHNDAVHFLRGVCAAATAIFGQDVIELRLSSELLPAPEDAVAGSYAIPKGTVAGIINGVEAFVADSVEPWLAVRTCWIATSDMAIDGITPEEHWVISIKGAPSLRMGIAMLPGNSDTDARRSCGEDYVATIAACLQAVAVVATSPPGILEYTGPVIRWDTQLRRRVSTPGS